MKRIVSILLVFALLLSVIPATTLSVAAYKTSSGYEYEVNDGKATIISYDVEYEEINNLVIPSTLGGYPVTELGYGCLRDQYVFNITIPEGVTKINGAAFSHCEQLESITLPNSLTYIGNGAFEYCRALESVMLPDKITHIGNSAFRYCGSLKSVTLPKSLVSLGEWAFLYCDNLQSITIPNGVTEISVGTFSCCHKLQSAVLPQGIVTIGAQAFESCHALQYVNIPDGVTTIGNSAFSFCRLLPDVTLPSKLEYIGGEAFSFCESIQKVVIPSTVTFLGKYAFWSCDGLKSVIVCEGVTDLGQLTFAQCETLSKVYLPKSITAMDNPFNLCESLGTVHYGGSQEQWAALELGEYFFGGNVLYNITPFYNSSGLLAETLFQTDSGYVFKVVNSAGEAVGSATVTMTQGGDTTTYTTDADGYAVIEQSIESDVYFTVSADGYCTYSTLNTMYAPRSIGADMIVLYTPEEEGMKLTSAILQKTDSTHEEIRSLNADLLQTIQRISKRDTKRGYYKIICGIENAANVKRYVLYQNGNILQTSVDGTFKVSVSEFGLGKDVYVGVVNQEERIVYTPLNLEVCNDADVSDATISFGEKLSFTVGEDTPYVGGTELSFDLPDLPIEMEWEDGKVFVGINCNVEEPEDEDDPTITEQFEDIIDLMATFSSSNSDDIAKDFEGFLKSKEMFDVPAVGEVEMSFCGAGEATWSENGLDTIEIQAALMIDASVKKGWQTMVGWIPVTVQIKVGVEGNLEASILWNFKTNKPSGDVELSVKPYLNAFGGVGVGELIGVGAYGDAEIEVVVQLIGISGLERVELSGELGLKAYAGPLTYERAFAKATWTIYDRTKPQIYAVNSPRYLASAFQDDNYAIDDVSYLKDQSEWLGEQTHRMRLFAARNTVDAMDIRPLLDNTYRNAQPAIAASSTHAVLAYVDGDIDRAAQNVSVVMYSVYDAENGTWGEPKKLDTNATLDTAPTLYSDGETIWLAYQDSSREYSESGVAEEYIASQNIVVAAFDGTTETFVVEKEFVSDGTYYRSPQLTCVNDTPALVWLSGENNDVLGQGGNNAVLCAYRQNGEWGEPVALAQDICTISNYAIGDVDGKLGVLYVADSDNQLVTTQDRALILLTNGASVTVKEGNVSGVQYTKLPSENEPSFLWTAENTVYTIDENQKENEICRIGQAESVTVVGNRILYTASQDEKADVYAVVYDTVRAAYGTAVQVSNQEQYIEKLSGVSFNGTDLLLMTRKSVEIGTEEVTDACELAWAVLNQKTQLQIHNVKYDHNAINDGHLPLEITVSNEGTVAASGLALAVLYENGDTAAVQSLDETLAVGETKKVTVPLPLDDVTDITEFTVVVGETEQADHDTYVVEVGYADLAVQAHAVKIGKQNTLVCKVTNEGLSTTSGALVLYEKDEQQPIETIDITDIAPGESKTFSFDLTSQSAEGILTCAVKNASTDYSVINDREELYFDFSAFAETECKHQYDATRNEADCDTNGSIVYRCACGHSYKETIPATGQHHYENSTDTVCNKCEQTRVIITAQPKTTYTQPGATAKVTVTALGDGLTYTWYIKNSGTTTYAKSSVTAATYAVTMNCKVKDRYVYCVVTDKYGMTAKSNTAVLRMTSTATHTYNNACDTTCNVCGATRTITHTYKTTTTKATTSKDGSIVKKCTVCGKVASSTTIKYAKTIALSTTSYTYNGSVITPSVTVKDSAGKTLTKNTHYTVTYASGRKNVGTYTVTVKGMGNYSFTKILSFKINPRSISSYKLSTTSYTYNGKVKTPSVTVKNSSGTTLTKNTHYTVTYASGRKNVGTYNVTIKGKGNYTGTKTLTFKINPAKLSSYKLSATSYTYDGKVKKPTVTVKNSSGTKLTTSSYTVTYASGRKNVGTYKVTIKGKGNYTGTKTLTFKINPAKTTVSKLTAGKKSITVAITKKSTQVTGYQIQYSTSKSFSKATTKTISSYKTTKYTLKSLSAKKTYYVRVRTYKTVNGTKYYSGWSTYKYVKTK